MISGRTSSDLDPDGDVSLLAGGRLLTLAFWVAMVAVAVMLVGFRKLALAPRPADEGAVAGEVEEAEEEPAPAPTPSGRARRKPGSGKASLAFALGIGGFIIVIGSSLAVALGSLALGEIRASDGVLPGRGLATAAVVLGLVALCLLVALVGVGTLAATPSS